MHTEILCVELGRFYFCILKFVVLIFQLGIKRNQLSLISLLLFIKLL